MGKEERSDGEVEAVGSKFPLSAWEVSMASTVVLVFVVGLLGVYLTLPVSDYSFLKLPRSLEDLQILRKNMNATGTQESSVMKPLEQRQRTGGHLDIVTCRLRNWERQCRYRARKRLEAEIKKSYDTNESTLPQVVLQQNGIHNPSMTRVHCKQDWKKDARRAHATKVQQVIPNGTVNSSESQTSSMPSGIKAEPSLEIECHSEITIGLVNSETHRTVVGRRDWKADARKKKC